MIPFPTHELHLNRVPDSLTRALVYPREDDSVQPQPRRFDSPGRSPRRPTPSHPPIKKKQLSTTSIPELLDDGFGPNQDLGSALQDLDLRMSPARLVTRRRRPWSPGVKMENS